MSFFDFNPFSSFVEGPAPSDFGIDQTTKAVFDQMSKSIFELVGNVTVNAQGSMAALRNSMISVIQSSKGSMVMSLSNGNGESAPGQPGKAHSWSYRTSPKFDAWMQKQKENDEATRQAVKEIINSKVAEIQTQQDQQVDWLNTVLEAAGITGGLAALGAGVYSVLSSSGVQGGRYGDMATILQDNISSRYNGIFPSAEAMSISAMITGPGVLIGSIVGLAELGILINSALDDATKEEAASLGAILGGDFEGAGLFQDPAPIIEQNMNQMESDLMGLVDNTNEFLVADISKAIDLISGVITGAVDDWKAGIGELFNDWLMNGKAVADESQWPQGGDDGGIGSTLLGMFTGGFF